MQRETYIEGCTEVADMDTRAYIPPRAKTLGVSLEDSFFF